MDTSQSRAARSVQLDATAQAVGAERHAQGHSTLIVGSRHHGASVGQRRGLRAARRHIPEPGRAVGARQQQGPPIGAEGGPPRDLVVCPLAQDPAAGQILDPGRPAGIGHGSEAVGTKGRSEPRTITLHPKALEKTGRSVFVSQNRADSGPAVRNVRPSRLKATPVRPDDCLNGGPSGRAVSTSHSRGPRSPVRRPACRSGRSGCPG